MSNAIKFKNGKKLDSLEEKTLSISDDTMALVLMIEELSKEIKSLKGALKQ